MDKFVIGVDFGTLSGRSVIVNVRTGEEKAVSVFNYPHGVMDEKLPDGTPLGVDWALQHPDDYLMVFSKTIPEVMLLSGVQPSQVIGLGIDFTACTMLPVTKEGTPLCKMEKFSMEPNAWIKLWKHHAAQDHANRLNSIAEERGEDWLERYGGKISSEWLIQIGRAHV